MDLIPSGADVPPDQQAVPKMSSDRQSVPPPPTRHATPSAPWPWIDIKDKVDQVQLQAKTPPVPKDCDHTECNGKCWKKYPQSRFPNWTKEQVIKCKIRNAIDNYDRSSPCSIHILDVHKNGIFKNAGVFTIEDGGGDDDETMDAEWNRFKEDKQGSNVRVRALFVENMSGPVLRMLGAKYNIEPFFFSSSLNWIPSRFQEDLREGEGDHITITLPFIQVVSGEDVPASPPNQNQTLGQDPSLTRTAPLVTEMIDIHAPLRTRISDGRTETESALVLDLLSVHLIRNVNGNTIISYHADKQFPTTTKAKYLHERIQFAGQSVYWEKMLDKAEDPTFLLLIFFWQAVYAWDEALQHLNEHICNLESKVIRTSSMWLTQRLHTIRAHHLGYANLLKSFKKSIEFIERTPNPSLTEKQRNTCHMYLKRECEALIQAIDRLDSEREMQGERLKNVLHLVFSSVRINDSQIMKSMTEAALKDSEGEMKQVSYLTMFFLPAYFSTYIFSMNINPINPLAADKTPTPYSLPIYFEIMIPLTAVIMWVIVAFLSEHMLPKDISIWKRLAWPFLLPWYLFRRAKFSTTRV